MPESLTRINESIYLEFGNAILFGMALCALIVWTDLLLVKIRALIITEGWIGLWHLIWDYITKDRPFEQELTVSVYIIFLAIAARTFFIWRWRDLGALSIDFPL